MGFGDEVSKVLDIMREQREIYKDYLSQDAIDAGFKLVRATKGLWSEVKEEIIILVKRELPLEAPHATVWWYSVLMGIEKKEDLFFEMISYIRTHQNVFSANTNYYLFYQLKGIAFSHSYLETLRVQTELLRYFREIVKLFSEKVDVSLEPIPLQNRNQNQVLVLTEQVLGVSHGPTKTALDRCKCMMDKMGMQVLLINTTEILSCVGEIPFWNQVVSEQTEELEVENSIEWKGVRVPYIQCVGLMPERQQLNVWLDFVRKLAPRYVVAIGGSGMLANLVNKMIPVLVVGLCPSSLEYTSAKYQTIGRAMTDVDRYLLQEMGDTEKNVIESIFTSSLKPQSEKISRKELGLGENDFVLVTVGMRLDQEITDEFLQMLDRSMRGSMRWILWGVFTEYEKCLDRYPKLKERTIFAGTCEDILSRLEICDLYVNPTRKGGGTSCVEAMYKGLPVVTVNYGDVSVNAGADFCVADYDEMSKKIERYYEDTLYYEEMQKRALHRVEVLLDTEKEFVRIIDEVDQRECTKEKKEIG